MFYICKILSSCLIRNIYIQKIFGVVLIAIFLFSSTPTKYLHWLFANHTDFISKTLTDSNKPQINAPGIDCHCETNVVIAPYTMQKPVLIKPSVRVFPEYAPTTISATVFSEPISFGLRGPPSVS